MSDVNDDVVKAVWRSQPTEVQTMSISYVRHRASELERAFRIRSVLEQGTCILALIWCACVIAMAPHAWIKAGVALLLVGIAYAMMQWRRRAAAHGPDAIESIDVGLVFYRRELERKRDIHRTLWRWYLLPMAPGVTAILTWNFFGDQHTKGTWTPWIVAAMVLAWIAFAVIYEWFKAAQCQREIDALSTLDRDVGSPSPPR
jgi:hypothetical protein